MIEISDVNIDAQSFKIGAFRAGAVVNAALKDHVDDLAREVEARAKELAPRGPTGRLKAEGIVSTTSDQSSFADGRPAGETVTNVPAFGGGRSVRGAGGRFTAAEKNLPSGHVFSGTLVNSSYFASVQLNPLVKHARWVHEGTGLFGPYHSPIVPRKASHLVFYWHGRKWRKKSVRGQKPQPFLTESFEYVRNVYEPAKLAQLRAEIAAAT